MVELSTVNRMAVGSNPTQGANDPSRSTEGYLLAMNPSKHQLVRITIPHGAGWSGNPPLKRSTPGMVEGSNP